MTVYGKAITIAQFFDFVIARYQADINRLTGHVVIQPIDEFNRPSKADYGTPRVPPSTTEVQALFGGWRDGLPQGRRFLPAARDYLVASLWRRAGLRINETVLLDIRDRRPDLGPSGKLHVRFGKGSRGRGPKPRLVSAINQVDALLEWWLNDVRHRSMTNGTTRMHRCCPANAVIGSPAGEPGRGQRAAHRADRDGGPPPAGVGRAPDAACAAAFLRVLAV
ncbi:hypothetical protein [Actinomadura rubrisoli]|uniref:hypothetical protein n=1 Tax=Actinomadura rubrisoli TaxID=2530368 RepID=UPI001A9DC7C1|nr:hypothetical protein [Actinomadura rubrisoli]